MSTPGETRNRAQRRGQRTAPQLVTPVVQAPPLSLAAGPKPLAIERVTIELAVYAAVLLVGFAIRLGHLDVNPLDPAEAGRAFSGWQLIRGETPLSWQEPLVILSAALAFLTLGDSDVMARVVPVAVGSALVVLPWLLRPQLGRTGALLASVLIAISPTFVFYSRTLSGDIFAAALALGLVACVTRYVSDGHRRWAVIGAGLIALLLNAGAPGVAFLLVFVAYFALVAALGKKPNEYMQAWDRLRADKEALSQAVPVLLGGFVLVGSGLLGNASGLKFPALSAWVTEFDVVPNGQAWHYHLRLLLGYEPLILILGLAWAIYTFYRWQRSQVQLVGVHSFLIFWVAAAFLAISFTGSKHGGQLLLIALPLALLAGSGLGEIVERMKGQLRGVGSLLLIGGLPFVVYAYLLASELTQRSRIALWYEWMLVFLALTMVTTLVAAAIAHSGKRMAHFALLTGVVLLIAYSIHATWRTAYAATEAEALSPTLTSHSLVDAVQEIQGAGMGAFPVESVFVAVDPALRSPELDWYLRGFNGLLYTEDPVQGTQAVIWPVDKAIALNLQEYSARKVRLRNTWSGEGGTLGEAWRWLLFREPFGIPRANEIVLYFHIN